MMPSVCLSLALFCSPKSNIHRILWMFCFRFNASETCWTVYMAFANYNFNAVSLPVCLGCTQLHSCMSCLCACGCVCARHHALRGHWPTSDAPIIHVHCAGSSQWLSWWEFCKLTSYATCSAITALFLQWNNFHWNPPKGNLLQQCQTESY